tara:strand:- start:111 stop:539 length:429 start_codon:yes stop_codon:yes gene_type:complete
MKKFFLILTIITFNLFLALPAFSEESKYFIEAKKLYKKNDLEGAKFLFEKDIVFNPKSEMSYFYLSKIFERNENEDDQETNLNAALLLNPKNEEALFSLIELKIKQSNFNEARKLKKQFKLICESFCSKEQDIEKKLKSLSP